jgi:uncharacterized protein
MKFLLDQPLGGLARWLRLCGLDAQVMNFSPRQGVGLPPPVPGACILTRQGQHRQLRRDDVLVLAANDPQGQLLEVFRRLKLSRRDLAPLSRCGECNDLLTPVSRETAQGLVPDHVFHTQAEFFQCPRCGRLYWPGSHPARITAQLQHLLREQEGGRPERSSSRKGASHGV